MDASPELDAVIPFPRATKVNGMRLASFSLRSTAGSPRGLTRALIAKAKLTGMWREKPEQTKSGPVIVKVVWPNVT